MKLTSRKTADLLAAIASLQVGEAMLWATDKTTPERLTQKLRRAYPDRHLKATRIAEGYLIRRLGLDRRRALALMPKRHEPLSEPEIGLLDLI